MPSIKDVAKLAGVSPMTASRVINGSGQVSGKMKLLVGRAVEQLGYRPNFNARSLRVQKSKLLGLILPDIENPLFSSLAKYVELAANKRGYNVMFGATWEDGRKEKEHLEIMFSRQIEGMLISVSSAENVDAFLNCPVPLILLDRKFPDTSTLPSLTVDNAEVGRLAARHLLSLGLGDFACIAGPQSIELFAERLRGFQSELTGAGMRLGACVTVRDMNGLADPERGSSNLRELLRLRGRRSAAPAGLFCANDLSALGAMQAAHKMGLDVPGRLAIVGVDDIPACRLTTPTLTSVAQPVAGIAEEGVRLLIAMITDRDCRPENLVLQPELIVRESTSEKP